MRKTVNFLLCLMVLGTAGSAWAGPWRHQRYADDRYVERYEEWGPDNSLANRFGIFGNIGVASYAMADENQYLDSVNSYVNANGGHGIDTINSGLSWNMGCEWGFTDFFLLGLEYSYLNAGTSGPLLPGESATIDLPASEAGAFMKWACPIGNRFLLYIGLGLYNFWVSDATERYTYADGTSSSNTYNGETLSTKTWLGGQFFFTRHLALGFDAGYRFARINNIYDQWGRPVINNDGTNFTLDYSGPFAQGGLRLYF